ncbi:hypothetical protein M501DRAFT_1017299 [Patellaria atrata CBS 101060]|uniref:NACHT domain-containing protein n=1 Tax=Patellaria atrata CBS 101060 TaxID=1346257 RepID=A0A9P4SAZ1_9PEZI|nr:hypothetical protein M501DRAFT_1017299 [Patellaria atrata CBS 101060]
MLMPSSTQGQVTGSDTAPWVSGLTTPTTLFSHVVQEISDAPVVDPSVALLDFYCTISNNDAQDSRNVLGSLVAQLSKALPHILRDVEPIYEQEKKLGLHKRLRLDNLKQLLSRGLASLKGALICIDAVNESEESVMLVKSLVNVTKAAPNIRLLLTITLFPDKSIVSDMDLKLVTMEAILVMKDIGRVVSDRLASDRKFGSIRTELKDEVEEVILDGADGMFRWAQLTLDNLSACRTGREIKRRLTQIPPNPNQTYSNMLNRLHNPSDMHLAREALLIRCFATKPLTLTELGEAVALEDRDCSMDEDSRLPDPYVLINICQGLLIYRDLTDDVYLAHSSIKTFLTSEWIVSSPASFFTLEHKSTNARIMHKCFTYLIFEDFVDPTPEHSFFRGDDWLCKQYSFLDYAVLQWGIHEMSVDQEGLLRISEILETTKLPRGGNFSSWVQYQNPQIPLKYIEASQPLYYAASFGLVAIVEFIL